MTKIVYTHNGVFHADEVTAVALLEVFKGEQHSYEVHRVPHQTKEFQSADFIIDIGRSLDGIKHFDHHQYQGGKSSAGLIWDYIGLSNEYPEISELIKLVDDNDVGVLKCAPFEYPTLIGSFNANDIHSLSQENAFYEAKDFAVEILKNLRDIQIQQNNSQEICEKAELWPGTKDVLNLNSFVPNWQKFINGSVRKDIEAVVWYDDVQQVWDIQVAPKKLGSYEKNGKSLLPWDKMDFVHAGQFFAVAPTKELMDEYIHNHRA